MQDSAAGRAGAAGGFGQAERQSAQAADRQEGESLGLQRIAVPADGLDRGDRGGQARASMSIRVALWRPPPVTRKRRAGAGNSAVPRATLAAVKAASVAAPSAGRQLRHGVEPEFQPIEGFGRGPVEKRMVEHPRQDGFVDPAGARQPPAFVEGHAGA